MTSNFDSKQVYDLAKTYLPKELALQTESALQTEVKHIADMHLPYKIPVRNKEGGIHIPQWQAIGKLALDVILSPDQKGLPESQHATIHPIARDKTAQILFALFYASQHADAYTDKKTQEKHNGLHDRLVKEIAKEHNTLQETEERQKLYDAVENEYKLLSKDKTPENFAEEFIELYFLAAKNVHGSSTIKMSRNRQSPKYHIEVAEPERKYLKESLKKIFEELKKKDNPKIPRDQIVETNLDYRIAACKNAFIDEVNAQMGESIQKLAKTAALAGILDYIRQTYGGNFSTEKTNPFEEKIRQAVEAREAELETKHKEALQIAVAEKETIIKKELEKQIKEKIPDDYNDLKTKVSHYEAYFDKKIASRKEDKKEFEDAANKFSVSNGNPSVEKLKEMVKERKPNAEKASLLQKMGKSLKGLIGFDGA